MKLTSASVAPLFAMFMAGCAHEHVTLSVPETSAPLPERVHALKNLAPHGQMETHVYIERRFGPPVFGYKYSEYLQLENGTLVYYPEDLLPVLPDHSASAKAARKSHSMATASKVISGFGVSLLGLGLIGIAAGIVASNAGTQPSDTPEYLFTGALASLLTGGVLAIVEYGFKKSARASKDSAFLTYGAGLQERLDVCWDGRVWLNCSSTYPQQPAGPPGAIPPLAIPLNALPPHP